MDWIKLTPETRPKLDEMVLCVCSLKGSTYYHEVYYGRVIDRCDSKTGFITDDDLSPHILRDVTHFCRIELPEDSNDFEKEES